MTNKNPNISTTDNFYKALQKVFDDKTNSTKEKDSNYFVYFNQNNGIVCITPQEDESLNDDFKYALFPYSQIKGFITGEESPQQYTLSLKEGSQTEYEFKTKILQVNHLRTVDQFLTEITDSVNGIPHIIIENRMKEKKLIITLDSELRKELTGGYTEKIQESQINVKGVKTSELYFTLKDNPCFLLETFRFSLAPLIVNEVIEIPYKVDLEYTSLFTKKVFDNYMYIVS